MAEKEGNNHQEGEKGDKAPEGEKQPNVEQQTADALKTQLAERDEVINTLKAKNAAVNEESKGRRLKLEKYEAEKEADSKKKADASGDLDEIRREFQSIFDAKDRKIEDLTGDIRNLTVNGTIRKVASAAGAIKPDQVAQLIKSNIGYDDKNVPYIKLNGSNQAATDKETGLPMTVESFTKKFLGDNKHLVSASGNTGAGSAQGQRAGETTITYTPEQIKNMTPAEYQKNRDVIFKQARAG